MRNGGRQPVVMSAGKKILPTKEPMRPTIMLSETIIVLSRAIQFQVRLVVRVGNLNGIVKCDDLPERGGEHAERGADE